MALSHLILLCLVGSALADSCQAPGSIITTTKSCTTTTTVSAGDADEDSVINAGDRALIRSTWAQAKKDSRIAPQILLRLLQRNPALQQKFPRLASVPQDQLANNHDVQAQAYTIMAGLNEVIEASGSRLQLAQEVAHLGESHNSRASAADLKLMGEVIVEVLADRVGLSAQAKSAWQNGLRALADGVAANLKDAQDIADPRTGLTPRQVATVRGSWERVRSQRSKLTAAALKGLLKQNPALQQKFARFANVPVDALAGDAEFQKQAGAIADRIDSIVADLGSGLRLKGELIYMAVSHKARGVGREQMEVLSGGLIQQLAGAGVSADEQAAWKQVLQVLGSRIEKIQSIVY